jgi:hypothetical protein
MPHRGAPPGQAGGGGRCGGETAPGSVSVSRIDLPRFDASVRRLGSTRREPAPAQPLPAQVAPGPASESKKQPTRQPLPMRRGRGAGAAARLGHAGSSGERLAMSVRCIRISRFSTWSRPAPSTCEPAPGAGRLDRPWGDTQPGRRTLCARTAGPHRAHSKRTYPRVFAASRNGGTRASSACPAACTSSPAAASACPR